MGKTFAEKVLARKAGLESVVPAQIVTVEPKHLLTHDNTAATTRVGRMGTISPSLGCSLTADRAAL